MNIVLINFDSVANSYSGTARVFANMANNLASKGHNVTGLSYELRQGKAAFSINPKVCLRNCCSNLYEKIFHNDALAKLRTFYISNRKDRRIRRVRLELQNKSSSIKKALDDASPDVIIAFQQEITYLLMEILHVQHPIITMVHNKPSFYFEKPEFEIYKPCLDRCACVQVLMPQYVKEAQLFLDQKNIVYIPNVVPQYPEFNSKKKNVILNIAKIAARKRQHLIVEAFSMIANKYPDWIVELWGWDQSEYAEKLRKQIKSLGLESKVKLCGETKQVTQKLQEASIFVFPSAYEGFSLALTEAMSMRLPVIGCRDCIAVSSLIDDNINGLTAEANAEDLAKKLELLITNPNLRESLGQQAKFTMKNFSPDCVWAQWDKLLESVSGKYNKTII